MTNNKDVLYDWIFHYNPYKEWWYAFKREDMVKFFNDKNSVNHCVAAKHSDLVDYILNVESNG
jgi:hypothetical protein